MADATSHVGRLGGIKSKGDLPQRHSLTFAFLFFQHALQPFNLIHIARLFLYYLGRHWTGDGP